VRITPARTTSPLRSASPPAGGTYVLRLLNIIETADLSALGEQSIAAAHLRAEACKLVFADRSKHSANPDFANVPYKGLA
jgi:gamma-glutamyltranspeptidase/glutathione hydrolase